jgi:hypothetical protein
MICWRFASWQIRDDQWARSVRNPLRGQSYHRNMMSKPISWSLVLLTAIHLASCSVARNDVFKEYLEIPECGLNSAQLSNSVLDQGVEKAYYIKSNIWYDGKYLLSTHKFGTHFSIEKSTDPRIRQGDILIAIDGQDINAYSQLYNLLDYSIGRLLTVQLVRSNKDIFVTLENRGCKTTERGNLTAVIGDLLYSGDHIRLLIMDPTVVDVSGDIVKSKKQESIIQGIVISSLIDSMNFYVRFGNFELVSRDALTIAMKEVQLAQMGFLSERDAINLGEQVGATHVVISRIQVTKTRKGIYEDYSFELVGLSKGIVLATEDHQLFVHDDSHAK